jgi:transposase InsO family protein
MGSIKLYGLVKYPMICHGIKCGRDRFIRILREEGLLVRKRKNYTRTTQSYHRFYKYPNQIKDVEINRPEQVYVNDITYIKAGGEHSYLALTTDAYSKRIMGYHLSDDMKVTSVAESVKMAIKNSKNPEGIIHHSDRGLQYCHPDYIEMIQQSGMKVSMTTTHDPYENSIAERVNGILKNEYRIGDGYPDKETAKLDISRVIWIYNHLRPHMSCCMLTPDEAHKQSYYRLRRWGRSKSTAKVSPAGSPVKAKSSGENADLDRTPGRA